MKKTRLIIGILIMVAAYSLLLVISIIPKFRITPFKYLLRQIAILIGAVVPSFGCAVAVLKPNRNKYFFNSKLITIFSILVLLFLLGDSSKIPFNNPESGFCWISIFILFIHQIQMFKSVFALFVYQSKKQYYLYNLSAIFLGTPFFYAYFQSVLYAGLIRHTHDEAPIWLLLLIPSFLTALTALFIVLINKPAWRPK